MAWVVGAIVYLWGVALFGGFDGPALLVQPICAAVCSAHVVGLGLIVGLILRSTRLGRWWRSSRVWAVVTAIGSVAVLCGGTAVGLTEEFTNPDTGERFVSLHTAAALPGYFFLLFAIAFWPLTTPQDT